MKKLLLLITLLAAGSLAVQAQSTKSSAYNNGDNLLNVGIGLGTPYFGAGYSSSLPVNPTVTFEHGVTDAISVGGTASFARSKYDLGSGFNFTENAVYFGVRGSYHFGQLIDLGSKADLYGGVSVGYVAVSVSDNQGDVAAAAGGAGYGLFGGIKYYFQPNFGVYAEAGYASLSYLNLGVAFKF